MNIAVFAAVAFWQPLVWILLGMVATMGLIALVRPKLFALLADRSSKWVDTSKVAEMLEKPHNIDDFIFRYCRTFGVAVIVSAVFLAFVVLKYAT